MQIEFNGDKSTVIIREDDRDSWYSGITCGNFESGRHSHLYLSFSLNSIKELQEKLNELLKEE
jgi:hypothetical protein